MKRLVGVCLVAAAAALAGCSRPTAEEYFARAQQEERKAAATADSLRSLGAAHESFESALKLFRELRKEYPQHPLAEAALIEIANIWTSGLRDPQEAINTYKLYCGEYPDGKQAPLSMFLIGYLYNNEVHNTDSAAAAYRRFLEKYPDNEMAMSAKFELSTLGKTPDESLPPLPAAKKPNRKPPA